MSWAVHYELKRVAPLTDDERLRLERHAEKRGAGHWTVAKYTIHVAPEAGVLANGFTQLPHDAEHRDVRRVLAALSELRQLVVDATLEVSDDYESFLLVGKRYTLGGRIPSGGPEISAHSDDRTVARGRKHLTWVPIAIKTTGPLALESSNSRLQVRDRVVFDAALRVRGNGPTTVHAVTMFFLGREGDILHADERCWSRSVPTNMVMVLTHQVRLPAGVKQAMRAVEIHARCEQHSPMELVIQVPVTSATNTGAWELGPWRRIRSRGPKIVDVSASATHAGLDLRVAFAPAQPGLKYTGLELCVLATTGAGVELASATVASDPGTTSTVTFTLDAQARARVETFDVRLRGVTHHDGVLARYDVSST